MPRMIGAKVGVLLTRLIRPTNLVTSLCDAVMNITQEGDDAPDQAWGRSRAKSFVYKNKKWWGPGQSQPNMRWSVALVRGIIF